MRSLEARRPSGWTVRAAAVRAKLAELRGDQAVRQSSGAVPAALRGFSVAAGAVPDVLAPGLRVVFCGINPGRVSAAAAAHFANPRNDFWRFLHDAGFTPRLLDRPSSTRPRLRHRLDQRRSPHDAGLGRPAAADFAGAAERLERLARELSPGVIAFVGKEAYRGVFRQRPELGLQTLHLAGVTLFVLPSTSPANAAVPYRERLRWFHALERAVSSASGS